jgi:hypothetical protein
MYLGWNPRVEDPAKPNDEDPENPNDIPESK